MQTVPLTSYPLLAPVPATFAPSPVPMNASLGRATGPDGRTAVIFQVVTPQGVQTYFFDEDGARAIGKGFIEQATGIMLAPANALAK